MLEHTKSTALIRIRVSDAKRLSMGLMGVGDITTQNCMLPPAATQVDGVLYDSGSWGQCIVSLCFQGLVFRFSGLTAEHVEAIGARMGGYLLDDAAAMPDALFHCHVGVLEPSPLSRYVNDRNEYQPEVTSGPSALVMLGHNFRLTADLTAEGLRGEIVTADALAPVAVDVFDNVLRLAAAHAALAGGGLLLHSAGIVINGGAWLMLGRSNAGKSTLAGAALAAGRPILSDDINLLRPDGAGGFVSGAVPLTGDLRAHQIAGPDARFPVRGLLWLSQAETLGIEPMSAGEATARLLACCPVVNTDPYRLDRVLSVIERVLSVLPMHTLKFRRDDPFEEIEAMVLASIKPPSV